MNNNYNPQLGCGASCVYPLLAVRCNDWTMIGLESNAESVQHALKNILENGLDHRITVILQESESSSVFGSLFKSQPNATIDFCMCNPPFFESVSELHPADHFLGKRNRSGNRRPAKCPQTGSADELCVSGGEIEFVRRIIQESCELQKRIRIYTTMLGHKASVPNVVKILKEHNISNICTSEFCQGHTTRWGIAWSFDDSISLKSIPQYGPSSVKTLPETKTYSFTIQREQTISLSDIKIKLEKILQSIGIAITDSIMISNCQWTGKVLTYHNTWSNQRRRRREAQRNHGNGLDEIAIPEQKPSDDPLLVAKLTILRKQPAKLEHEIESIINLEYVSGTGQKDAANQLLRFIQNNWK